MFNVRGMGCPLAARRDTNENTFLRNGVKMIFRGGPSVRPGLSVTSRVCVVFRSVVLGAPALHSQPHQNAAKLSLQTLPPLALSPPSCPAGFSHSDHSLGKGGPWSSLSRPCLGSPGSSCKSGGTENTSCPQSLLCSTLNGPSTAANRPEEFPRIFQLQLLGSNKTGPSVEDLHLEGAGEALGLDGSALPASLLRISSSQRCRLRTPRGLSPATGTRAVCRSPGGSPAPPLGCSCPDHPAQFRAGVGSAAAPLAPFRRSDFVGCHPSIKGVLLFSRSVVSSSLQLHGLQHTRLPGPSPTPRACSNSCPSSG